jgi:uncharacterized membrane protein YfcA
MLLFKIPFEHIAIVALACNLIVVSGSSFNYIKNKDFSLKKVLPFVLTSIPAAYFAGMTHIPKDLFKLILGLCLFLAAVRMFFQSKTFSDDSFITKSPNPLLAGLVGLLLGFLSGLVGIGGGIFLSPIMYNLNWGKPRDITSICCFFILFNSIAGLFGQLQKGTSFAIMDRYWVLLVVVLAGGLLGSYLGSKKLKPRDIQFLTSLLVLFVSLRILFFS